MGNCLASVFRRNRVKRHIVLILIGLDNAGKTQTVNNLVGEKDDKVLPTVGFKAVNLVHKDTPVTIYDLGGGPHFRQIWGQYYSEVHGVIFVIDSSDFSRLDECRTVLEEVLSHDKIAGKPVLVLANKQDKSGALDDIDVVDKLNIEPLVNRYRCPTLVESYTAQPQPTRSKKPKIDPGLRKGYQWLLNYIIRRYGDINLRVQTDIHAELERRKRMLNKASNTTTSNEEITQTGFENPTFTVGKANDEEKTLQSEGLIVVKPGRNSGDSTVTIESVPSGNASAKPKHSPLFGHVNNSVETVKVELEPRNEIRKLSPIVRNKSGGDQHIDFVNRPHSSPSNKVKLEPQSHSSTQDEDKMAELSEAYSSTHTQAYSPPHTQANSSIHTKEYSFPHTQENSSTHTQEFNSPHTQVNSSTHKQAYSPHTQEYNSSHTLAHSSPHTQAYISPRHHTWGHLADKRARFNRDLTTNMEIIYTDREFGNKSAYSEAGASPSSLATPPRPASASQLVRRQLELGGTQRRRLSLRYIHRNKTSPARASMLVHEPSKARRLDTGDCHRAPLTH